MAANVMEIYGSKVFNEHVMKERLPSATYKSLKNTLHKGAPLDIEVANVVASVMKRWAMELGATHYTHWFQPLTGITSEKHDGFVSPVGDGTAIMEFNGKELVRGEPDASSFPSGGLRATCEARGYTAWDPTSFAFVKDDVLCIPTAFVSYTGEALDKKTPLLRSMNALSNQAIRVLKLFGKDVDYVSTTVGPEQEYFLIKKEDYEARQDLILTGRTLFGAPSAKGQELEEHYFGVIRPEVSAFMKELDEELWKLGIPAKTKHNEVAPCQHELAPIFDTTNVAIDHNLLTMEMMKKLAPKYGLVCLQHEKPFEGVNGSGKHNNWSMSTTHENLLDPGDTPMENLQFLVFLAAVIKAVDEYADLLRTSVATPGNDHRLGANEAPPAIISIFVGEELEAVIDAIASDSPYAGPVKMKMDLGVDVLPKFSKDTTDRNRTSPFAFTGNKFEFRMPGSAENLSDCNTILNTAVAKELKGYADELEKADDFTSAAIALVKRTIRDHRRVIFNGNGYTAEWEEEAAKRGLPNKKNTPAALPALIEPKNIALMEDFGVLTKVEMESRYEVEMEHYSKIINIEALTMLEMARKQLLPAVNAYMSEVANTAASKLAVSENLSVRSETKALTRLSADADAMSDAVDELQAAVDAAKADTGVAADRLTGSQTDLDDAQSNLDILTDLAAKLAEAQQREQDAVKAVNDTKAALDDAKADTIAAESLVSAAEQAKAQADAKLSKLNSIDAGAAIASGHDVNADDALNALFAAAVAARAKVAPAKAILDEKQAAVDGLQSGYDAALAAYELAKSDRIAAEQKLSDEIARQEAEEVAKQQAAKQQAAYTPKHLAGTDTAQPGSLAQTGDRAGLIGETFVIGGTVLVAAGVFLDQKKRREQM